MKIFDFSIILLNNNDERLLTSLENIKNQDYDKDNIQIIVATTKLSLEQKKQIEELNLNILYSENKNFDFIKMYNEAIKLSEGKYLHFSNTSITYDGSDVLTKISQNFNNNLIATNLIVEDSLTNEKKAYLLSSKKEKEINLKRETDFNLALESYFINRKLIKNISFDKIFTLEAKEKFIVDLYEKEKKYYNLGTVKLVSKEVYEDNKSNKFQYDDNWYDQSIINWTKYLKKLKKIPKYLQEILVYKIYIKFKYNMNSESKYSSDTLFTHLQTMLKYIDSEIFLNKKGDYKYVIDRTIRQFLYHLKGEKKVPINLEKERINIYAINYQDNKLMFDCSLDLMDYIDEDEFKIYIKYNNEDINITKTKIFSDTKAFNKVINEKYMFSFTIDIGSKDSLEASFEYNGTRYPLTFNFIRLQSRIDNNDKAFWMYKDFIVRNKITKLKIEKKKIFNAIKYELAYLLYKYQSETNKKRIIKLIALRILYYLTKPIYKNKHIWITYDKLYKAGDNGEYLYQYGLKNNKNIYYLIKKDSKDYERLISNPNNKILVFNSLKAKLYALHAEVILKTHAGIMGFCGFDGIARSIIRGLLNAHVIEAQHGLTIQDIPEYQNRLADNIRLYLIASRFEYNNIIQDKYGYEDSQIKLTGISRYDGLKNNDKKQILITPTWRHNLASPSLSHGTQRAYNNSFKESDYYKIYNAVINNEKLIDTAKKYGYRITYLIHPTLATQIDDFDKNEFVDIVAASGDMSYEKLLTESSLMVTDYSGVQYDFAYMRKSIVYFHPNELPPHYNNGSIDYKKDGFGPITTTIDELVDTLCNYLKEECKNKEQYINRANVFFEFADFSNSKRMIEAVEEYLKEIN